MYIRKCIYFTCMHALVGEDGVIQELITRRPTFLIESFPYPSIHLGVNEKTIQELNALLSKLLIRCICRIVYHKLRRNIVCSMSIIISKRIKQRKRGFQLN